MRPCSMAFPNNRAVALSTVLRGSRWSNWRRCSQSAFPTVPYGPITLAWTLSPASGARKTSWLTPVRWWWRPTPLAWGLTKLISALWCITTFPPAWKPTTRRLAGPDAMAGPRNASCIAVRVTGLPRNFSSTRLGRTTPRLPRHKLKRCKLTLARSLTRFSTMPTDCDAAAAPFSTTSAITPRWRTAPAMSAAGTSAPNRALQRHERARGKGQRRQNCPAWKRLLSIPPPRFVTSA